MYTPNNIHERGVVSSMKKSVFTTEEIKGIIDGLYHTIGVRMIFNPGKYPNFNAGSIVKQSSFMDVCKVITEHLELPVKITPSFSSEFKSRGMVLNENSSTSGIGAQIHLPYNLPWYKTEALNNFPISITVPPEALAKGHYYLMTQLSHEFSHIYLHSRRDPQRESEWATDLCALMMGFAPLWRRGRTHTYTQQDVHQVVTNTVTQGYLSDEEFEFAVNYINKLRNTFENLRIELSSEKQRIQSIFNEISGYLEDISLLYDFHFKHPQKSFINAEDAKTFSKIAGSHYISEIKELLVKRKNDTNAIVKPLLHKKEFYDNDIKWMEDNLKQLHTIESKLNRILAELKSDYNIIFQNIDAVHYDRVFNNRVAAISKGICDAEEKIQKIHKEISVSERCLTYYNHYKKESIDDEKDAKTLSLICKRDYFIASDEFINNQQKRIEGIEELLKKAEEFYSIDDEVLSSKLAELKEIISTLEYCLKEQKDNLKVIKRNLSFLGKAKWRWDCFKSWLGFSQ